MKPWLQLCCAGVSLVAISLAFGLWPHLRSQQTLTIGGDITPPEIIVPRSEWVLVFIFAISFIVGLGLVTAGIVRRFRGRA